MKGARFGSSRATSSGQQRALTALLLALPLLGAASGAAATCLSGTGFTGFEVGGHTLFVGSASDSLTSSCLPISLFLEPGILAGETGRAEVTASQMGYSQGAAVSIGGQVSGGNAASVLGSVSYVFRVESLPGYSGPGTTDISLDVLLDVSGGLQASGIGSSAAASYTAA
jgi:hypothetical protein